MAKQRHAKLLDEAAAAVDLVSPWFYVGNLEACTIHVFGNVTGDEFDVEVSNDGDLVHGETTAVDGDEVVLTSETGDGMITVTRGVAYVRLRYTAAAGGGTITAWLHGLHAQD